MPHRWPVCLPCMTFFHTQHLRAKRVVIVFCKSGSAGLLLALTTAVVSALPAAAPQPLAPALAQARLSLGAPLGELPRFGVNLGGRTVWGELSS